MLPTVRLSVNATVTQDWLKSFSNYLDGRGLSSHSQKAYLQDLRSFVAWFDQVNHQAFSPDLLTSMDVRAYRRFRLDERQSAAATWNRALATLRVLAMWGMAAGFLSCDPTDGVKCKSQEDLPPRWLSKPELNKLLRVCERQVHAAHTEAGRVQALRDQAMVYLMAYTGLREGEVVSLNLGDIEISERKGTVVIWSGKGEKERRVPLNSEVRRALGLLIAVYSGERALFIGKKGTRITTRTVQRRVEQLGRAAEMDLTPHQLRHTFAKRLVDEHIPLNVVQKLLGHSRLETTLKYVKPGWEDFESAVEKI